MKLSFPTIPSFYPNNSILGDKPQLTVICHYHLKIFIQLKSIMMFLTDDFLGPDY